MTSQPSNRPTVRQSNGPTVQPANNPAVRRPDRPTVKPANRLSPAMRLNLAQAYAAKGDLAAAEQQFKTARAEMPAIQSAFSHIAWTRYVSKDMAYEKVIPYFEKDFQQGRLNGAWLLNYAQSLTVAGRESEAEHLVLQVYDSDPNLTNGFARCAFLRNIFLNYSPDKALPWFERDKRLGRLKGMFWTHYATVLAALGEITDALNKVDEAYAADPACVNAYSFVGWYGHVVSGRCPEKALVLFERDKKLGRLQANAENFFAGLYALLGNREKAEQIIIRKYNAENNVVGGNTLVGFCDHSRNKDTDYLRNMIEKDEKLGRLSYPPHHACLYAAVLLKYGVKAKAKILLEGAAARSTLALSYTKSWLSRFHSLDNAGTHKFITPEMEKIFAGNAGGVA